MGENLLPYNPVEPASNFLSNKTRYCIGYENRNTNGYYLTTCKLQCAKVDVGLEPMDDEILPGIVSYDRAQKDGAYIGQINSIAVSSFSGPSSGVWGYDYAQMPNLRIPSPLFPKPITRVRLAGKTYMLPKEVPVYSMDPLLEATQRLFGTVEEKENFIRFPPLPGSHVASAAKSANSELDDSRVPKPGYVWSYIALCIAEHRNYDSSLFVEDCGFKESATEDDQMINKYLKDKEKAVVMSCLACGVNQKVEYKEIFTSYRYLYCKAGEYGTAIAYAPYVLLATDAYPKGSAAKTPAMRLTEMSMEDWEAEIIGPAPRKSGKGKK